MTHDLPPGAWRCVRCGLSAFRTKGEPVCVKEDGAALIASLAEPVERPSDSETWDEG